VFKLSINFRLKSLPNARKSSEQLTVKKDRPTAFLMRLRTRRSVAYTGTPLARRSTVNDRGVRTDKFGCSWFLSVMAAHLPYTKSYVMRTVRAAIRLVEPRN